MKNYIYGLGIFTLALSLSGVPALARAENGDDVGLIHPGVRTAGLNAGVQVAAQGEQIEPTREQEKNRLVASSTRPAIRGGEDDEGFELEDDQDIATSNDDLNQKIESRRQQFTAEEASTTPQLRTAKKNENEVRLAVHALLSSKDLVGGIGQQVSDIAKEVDHSVASTTNAEAKIHSRGFFSKLLFGGDTASAEVIAQEAAKNQTRIDSLTTLLADATITPEVKATLDAQIAALKAAQVRLQALADKEKSAWGLFSWRF